MPWDVGTPQTSFYSTMKDTSLEGTAAGVMEIAKSAAAELLGTSAAASSTASTSVMNHFYFNTDMNHFYLFTPSLLLLASTFVGYYPSVGVST